MSRERDYETAPAPETSGRAIAALVFGVLAVAGALPCIGGVLAIWFGASEESAVGRAGLILGILSFAIPLLLLVLIAVVVLPVLFLLALVG